MLVQEELKKIEIEVMDKTKEAVEFLKSLYPLNNEYFMSSGEKKKIQEIKSYVEKLYERYINIFYSIPLEERNKYGYKNLLGEFNKAVRSIQGLDMIGPYSDEYELKNAFSKAYGFAKEAIEKVIEAENKNDIQSISKNKRILAACNDIFDAHFWGETYKENIQKYDNRLRTGRTVDDDLKEYYELVDETKVLAKEYANSIKNGITEDEINRYGNEFETIFNKEKDLLRFVPREMVDYVNLHWLKVDAERNPDKLLEDLANEQIKK